MKLLVLVCFLIKLNTIYAIGEVIFALNAGGESHTDSHGIRYRRDYLTVGSASDYGRNLDIKRVSQADKSIYETERYAPETFGYTIPMPSGNGDYVLWLKFSEVWFNGPNLKVFDVTLNDAVVVDSLDIFAKVGRGVAHDEIVPFQIRQNKLVVNGKALPFNNEIRVEFVKTDRDNPKINAIIVMKGTPDDVPKLPEFKNEVNLEEPEDEEKFDDEDDDNIEDELKKLKEREQQMQDFERENENQNKKRSVPPVPVTPVVEDPYKSDETSFFIPILVAIAALIPVVFCLCKI